MKLKLKLPLLLIPLITIPLLIVNYLAYSHLKKSASQEAFYAVSTLLDQIAEKSDNKIAVATANVNLFANYPVLQYYLQTQDPEERYGLIQRPTMKKLIGIQKVYTDYHEIRVLQPDGKVDLYLSNRQPDQPRNRRLDDNLLPLEEGVAPQATYHYDRNSRQLNLYTAAPLYETSDAFGSNISAGDLLGHLVITIDTDFLTRLIREMPIGIKGGLLLSDEQGNVLAAPDSLNLDELGFTRVADANRLPGVISSRQLNPAAHIPQLFRLETQNFYVGSKPLHDNLIAHILIPEHELLLISSDISLLVGIVTAIAILLAVPLLLYMLRRQILVPIKRISQALYQLGEGQEDIEIEAINDDEIGELSQSFNVMSRELRQSNAKIRALAFKDTLTGLSNRHMFGLTLEKVMADCRDRQSSLALLFLDLDNFKNINDTLGHQAGDNLLKSTALLLEKNLRSNDYIGLANPVVYNSIARLGGDEFIILLPHIHNREEVDLVASRIIKAMDTPIKLNNQEFHIGASVGITIFPEDGHTAEDLIKNADMAMYQAKKLGKHRYHYFSESIGADKLALVKMEQKLHKAINQRAFELYYQPQIDSQTRQIVSVETLIRWPDKEQGLITPDQFIPLAEETGLIVPIGEWVLETACMQLKKWHDQGLPLINLAVNVSGVQLNKADLLAQVDKALRASQLDPKYLHIELTESAILNGRELAIKLLNTLRWQGISIALDDFGTGYSSLSYLRMLPIDILKIDRSFISEIHQQHNAPILSAIITMAHALKLTVVAEGVEDQSQIDFMCKKRCDLLQGYYFSRPLPAEEMEALLQQQPTSQTTNLYRTPHSA